MRGQADLGEKERELFASDMVAQWFTADVKLGSLAIHLETPSCFAAGHPTQIPPLSLSIFSQGTQNIHLSYQNPHVPLLLILCHVRTLLQSSEDSQSAF